MLNVRLRRRGRKVHNARGLIDILGHARKMTVDINNCDDSMSRSLTFRDAFPCIAILSLGAT